MVERKTLEADFSHLFGSQIRFHGYLSELKRRGFRFLGPTTVYAFMQAAGLVDDHVDGCDVPAST